MSCRDPSDDTCAVARHAEHVEGRGGSVCARGYKGFRITFILLIENEPKVHGFTLQYEKCNRVVNMNVSACGRVPSTLSVLASMGYAPQCTNDIRQRHYGTTVVKPFLSVFGACVARHAYGKGLGSVAASTTLV